MTDSFDRTIPPENTIVRIDAVWMAISVDEDGTEGVCAVFTPTQGWLPLIAADAARLPFVIERAAEIAAEQQRLVKIFRLHGREEIDQFDGRQ